MAEELLVPVTADDVAEHVYELYTSRAPPERTNLGYVARTRTVAVTVAVDAAWGRTTRTRRRPAAATAIELEVAQSLDLLNAPKGSTTGAVLWTVSPLLGEWLLTPGTALADLLRRPGQRIIELGAGSAGVLGGLLALGSRGGTYVATDVGVLLPLLRRNLAAVLEQLQNAIGAPAYVSDTVGGGGTDGVRVEAVELDWEAPGDSDAAAFGPWDVVVAADTVYNDFLVEPLVRTLRRLASPSTHVVLAMQLRTHDVVEAFLSEALDAGFALYNVPADLLTGQLQHGFAVYYARLTEDS
ncbi:uncharacterized protein V1510DRAFT_413421 [Dipodascopsis tothii]|uniref:uncharacterized protein n=1 Tax=Dipodascopsis tothii TaxID=44089 RepID=UPI0034CE69E5